MRRRVTLGLAALAAACGTALAADPADAASRGEQEEDALRRRLTEREDRRRPPEPFSIDVDGRPLTLSGEVAFEADTLRHPALAGGTGRRSERLRTFAAEAEVFYGFGDALSVFAQARVASERERSPQGAGPRTSRFVERGEMWLHATRLGGTPLSLEVGRLKFEDERRWRWDEELDALRASYEGDDLEFVLVRAEEQARKRSDRNTVEPEHNRVARWIAHAAWTRLRAFELELWVLRQRDRSATETLGQTVPVNEEDDSDARLRWLGAAVKGELESTTRGQFDYWFEAARVRGDERTIGYMRMSPQQSAVESVGSRRVRGWGFDAGLRWTLPLADAPRLFAGYAFGSGGAERSFRQTGLQTNEASFGGARRYAHYGTLLDPELSNLRIATLGMGLSLLRSSSLDLVAHSYRQVEAATSLRASSLPGELTGSERRIGSAVDIVLALEEWDRVEFNLIASSFRAGPAFGALQGKRYQYGALALRFAF